MSPATENLEAWRGDTETYQFTLYDSEGVPTDLTGLDVQMFVYKETGDIEKSLSAGTLMVSDPTTGVVEVPFTSVETETFIDCRSPITYALKITSEVETSTVLAGQIVTKGLPDGDNCR